MRHQKLFFPSLLIGGFFALFILVAYTSPNEDPSADIPKDIRALLDQAEDLRCTAHYEPAIGILEQAQSLYREKGQELEALRLYDKILWMAIDTDFDSDAFLRRFKKAAAEIRPRLVEHPELEAILLMAKIQQTWIDDDIERAETTFEALETLLQKHPNWDYHAAAASHMASIYAYCVWEAEKCHKMAQLSIDLVHKNSHNLSEKAPHLHRLYPYYVFYNYDNLGSVELWNNNDQDACLETYHKAISFLQQGKQVDSLHYSTILNKMGEVYTYKGEQNKAIEYFENALIYLSPRMHLPRAECLKSIGDAYIRQAKDEEAIDYYKQTIDALSNIQPQTKYIQEEYVDIFRSMATSYVKLKKYEEAKNYLNKIGRLPAEADHKPSWTYATWGFLFEHTNELDKAILAHERSIVAYKKEGLSPGSAYWNLGKVAARKKDFKESTEWFHQSLLNDFEGWEDQGFRKNPRLEEIQNKHVALNSLADKLHSYYNYVHTDNLWQEHGQDLLELSNLTVACFEYVRNTFDRESSKRSLLETAYYTYEQAISIHLKLYEDSKEEQYLTKAFEFAEKSKSILLEDALKEENALSLGGIPDSLILLEESLRSAIITHQQNLHLAEKDGDTEAIAEHKKQLFNTRLKQDNLQKTLEEQYPKYFNLKYAQTAISLQEIQKALPEKTAIIEYFEGHHNIFVFSVTNKTLQSWTIPREEGYSKRLENFTEMLSNTALLLQNEAAAFSKYTEEGHRFYKNFIEQTIPEQAERLIIIPDGMLNYIAFEALLYDAPEYGKKQTVNFNHLPYLLNQYTISYNYSASMWLSQYRRPSKAQNNQVLAMAASYEPLANQRNNGSERLMKIRKGLAPIPGTLEEIALLEKAYSGTFLSKEAANEATFKAKAKDFGILHLAMHGLVNSTNPEFSSMAFTEDNQGIEDNFLHASEIKQLDLTADLVVLSACETGFGRYQHGEGVVSLGRSFMYAGVPSVLMTLWKINDYSSIFITKMFYENIQQGMEKDVALQKAKQIYLKNAPGASSHPSFWAAFVQLGDYKSITIAPKSFLSNWLLYLLVGLLILGLGIWKFSRK